MKHVSYLDQIQVGTLAELGNIGFILNFQPVITSIKNITFPYIPKNLCLSYFIASIGKSDRIFFYYFRRRSLVKGCGKCLQNIVEC